VVIKQKTKIKRNLVIKKLMEKKIQTRTFFFPMHKQTIFKKMNLFSSKEKYPNAEYLSLNGFYLPSGLGIKNYEIDYVATTLNEILR
jgi:perosamine synthetase